MRFVLLFALAACGGRSEVLIGDVCFENKNCGSIPYGYCSGGRCTRKCGPQAEVNTPLGGTHDTSCPPGSACVKEGPLFVCLRACGTTGSKLCQGICEDNVCKAACGDKACRPCVRGLPEGCVNGLYERGPY